MSLIYNIKYLFIHYKGALDETTQTVTKHVVKIYTNYPYTRVHYGSYFETMYHYNDLDVLSNVPKKVARIVKAVK